MLLGQNLQTKKGQNLTIRNSDKRQITEIFSLSYFYVGYKNLIKKTEYLIFQFFLMVFLKNERKIFGRTFNQPLIWRNINF